MTVLKVKSGAGGTWEEVGGIGVGVPAGGTTGQVLTKSSAADYATAWTSNQPVLANNSYLQGYRADGTTAQSLIGMTTADEVSIAPSLAAGKNVYVPRLTVQGPLTLADQNYVTSSTGLQMMMAHAPSGTILYATNANATFNADAGVSSFMRDIHCYGSIIKPGVGTYVCPDYVFEHAYRGEIREFSGATGAKDYQGLMPLDAVEQYTRDTLRLPGARGETYDLFARGDELLAEVEKLYLYAIQHEKRLKALEGR